MKPIAAHPIECSCPPLLSSRSQGWENILVEQFQHPAGEGSAHYKDEHTICLSLAPRPVRLLQIQDGKTYTGLYGRGDISITPAQTSFFARWDRDDHYLQIRLASRFMQRVASETSDRDADRLELRPQLRTRDPHIESIGMMLLAELKQNNLGGRLYIDSLANVLAVHLLREYATAKAPLPLYEGGLPERQLMQVLDYIYEHLEQDLAS